MDPLVVLNWLREELSDSLPKIGAGVAGTLLTVFGKGVWGQARTLLRKHREFDVAGYWIGECHLPSYGGTPQLEVWSYARSGEDLLLKFFAYDPDPKVKKPTKWLGRAIFRGQKLSGFYYLYDEYTYESGVFAMDLTALSLRGVYAQFDPKVENEPLYVSTTIKDASGKEVLRENARDYAQHRIRELPFIARLRMTLGLSPFKTFAEVNGLYQRCRQ